MCARDYGNVINVFHLREIWVESLSQAIKKCTEEHANSILPVGNPSEYLHFNVATVSRNRDTTA